VTTGAILDLWRAALEVIVAVSAPFLLACLAIGLAVAIVQTATQLQESVLTFVPKLGAALLVIALAGHWCLDQLGQFTTQAFTAHADARRTDAQTP
jgi:flagellar biosynthetic protein FliQ